MNDHPHWLVLERDAGDLEGQIYRKIRERVLSGELASRVRLPSTRALAKALEVARSTVVSAYDRLRAEGFVEGRAGAASRVSDVVVPLAGRSAGPPPAEPMVPAAPLHRALRPGVPDLASFPHRIWARCLAAQARSLRVLDLELNRGQGLPELRTAILNHVSATRGVSASIDRMFIVPSTRVALDLLSRTMLAALPEKTSSAVWIEEPGYSAAHDVFRAAGVNLTPVRCDEDGLDIRAVEAPPPRLIYTTPSHQYPSGVTMSLQRRQALLALARDCGAVIIEDDYDSEFYANRPIVALQGIDRSDVVCYIGTFSKTLAPGVRVAYVVIPRDLTKSFASVYRTFGGTVVPLHVQAALAEFINEGRLRGHLRRMRPIYAERMQMLADALKDRCGDILKLGGARNGLQLATWFRDETIDDVAAANTLATAGLGLQPMSRYYLGPPRPGLLFGIAAVDAASLGATVSTVARVLAKVVANVRPQSVDKDEPQRPDAPVR